MVKWSKTSRSSCTTFLRDYLYGNPKYVEVRLYGGLGNQLFQYQFGSYISKEFNLEVHFDLSWIIHKPNHESSDIRLLLDTNDIVFTRIKGRIDYLLSDLITKLSLRSRVVQFLFRICLEVEIENLIDIKLRNRTKFRGYYQNLDPSLVNHFELNLKKSMADSLKIEQFLANTEDSKYIAVHVRGGDYLASNSIYSNLDSIYYESAIKIALQQNPGVQLIVFTDDYAQAQKTLPTSFSYKYAKDLAMSTIEEFIIMSSATTIIISNSTFSYWAAIRQNNPEYVIAPNKWFKDSSYLSPKYPPKWIVI